MKGKTIEMKTVAEQIEKLKEYSYTRKGEIASICREVAETLERQETMLSEYKKKLNELGKVYEDRRELETMPFDMAFAVDGNYELCHATGFEVHFGDDPEWCWYNEYEDRNGELRYGR